MERNILEHFPLFDLLCISSPTLYPLRQSVPVAGDRPITWNAQGKDDIQAKLIDPALHARGWTEDLIRREETAGAVEIVDRKPHKRSQGRTDYTLRIKVTSEALAKLRRV